MTTLFVSPHFDDVGFSCVAHVMEARRRGRVLCATAFGAGQIARQHEDARALALLGAEQVVLPFADAPERLGITPGFSSLLCARYAREVGDRDALTATLRTMVAQEHVTHLVLPLGVGGHVDHRVAHAVALPALTIAFYEDYPYAHIRGATAARMRELGARPCDEDGRPLEMGHATAAEAHASARTVFAGLLGEDPSPEVTAELASWAARIAAPPPPEAPLGTLRRRAIPGAPALAARVARCYASQRAAWFPTEALVGARAIEIAWELAADRDRPREPAALLG